MSHFLSGMSKNVVVEYCETMIHDNMYISFLVVNSQQMEETRLRIKNRDSKREKSYEGGSSKGRF